MARPRKSPAKETPSAEAAVKVIKTPPPLPPPGELEAMIRTAAYFKAEGDGFRMSPDLYWREAEMEILARFRQLDR